MNRILFVCTGNTCRSPMAEAMLRQLAAERGLELEVKSAGVSAWDGTPMSDHAAAVLKENHVEGYETFASTALSEAEVVWADLILTLTVGHKRHVLQRFPAAADKTYTLREYAEPGEGGSGERDRLQELAAELQLKQALGQEPTPEELAELAELDRLCPNPDVADPFGGSLEEYRMTALQIREALLVVVDKLAPPATK